MSVIARVSSNNYGTYTCYKVELVLGIPRTCCLKQSNLNLILVVLA